MQIIKPRHEEFHFWSYGNVVHSAVLPLSVDSACLCIRIDRTNERIHFYENCRLFHGIVKYTFYTGEYYEMLAVYMHVCLSVCL